VRFVIGAERQQSTDAEEIGDYVDDRIIAHFPH